MVCPWDELISVESGLAAARKNLPAGVGVWQCLLVPLLVRDFRDPGGDG